jgi:hypothetical protein
LLSLSKKQHPCPSSAIIPSSITRIIIIYSETGRLLFRGVNPRTYFQFEKPFVTRKAFFFARLAARCLSGITKKLPAREVAAYCPNAKAVLFTKYNFFTNQPPFYNHAN